MTVASEISRVDPPYAGNGVTTVFPYTFKIFAAGDLRVILTDPDGIETTLVLGVDYTVSGAGSAAGGNVTTTVAPATDYTLSIERVLAPTQPVDLRNQGPFLAEVVERVADRLTMLVQQALAESGSALRLPKGEAATDLTTLLPPLADRKGRGLYFDDITGKPAAGSSVLGTTVSSVMEAVISAASRQAAIDLLAGGVTNNRVLRGNGTHVSLGQVELADMANLADARVMGRGAGSAGAPQALTLSGLTASGGVLAVAMPFWGRIISSTIVAISATGALTADRMHNVNCAANATLSLPPVAGNAGVVVGIKVDVANVGKVVVDGNGDEATEGMASFTMHKGGIALLYCNGTGWIFLVRDLAPSTFLRAYSSTGQAVTADSEALDYTEVVDSLGCWDGSLYTAKASGLYAITATADFTAATACALYILSTGEKFYGATRPAAANAIATVSFVLPLYADGNFSIRCDTTLTRGTTAEKNRLEVHKVGELLV